jgi:uncharacterized protein with beta-barrel porin domain
LSRSINARTSQKHQKWLGKALLTGALLVGSVWCGNVDAQTRQTYREVKNSDGNIIFRLDLYGDGQMYDSSGYTDSTGTNPIYSTRDFSDQEIGAILNGLAYWVEIIKPTGTVSTPVVLRAGIDPRTSDANAGAWTVNGTNNYPKPYNVLMLGHNEPLHTSNVLSDDVTGYHALMSFEDAWRGYLPPTQMTESTRSLEATFIHEFGHALGIDGTVMATLNLLTGAPGNANYHGDTNKQEAVKVYGDGTARDIPMSNLDYVIDPSSGGIQQNLGHFGLRNGLMTHQLYRNYSGFMEVELAAIQDIGYTVDRRNFFGRSVYTNNNTIVNTDGFYKSKGLGVGGNSDWLGYETGVYNTASHGLGLHIYGDNNNVTQQADLLSVGHAGGGIRVDGLNNKVIIDQNVKVYANGDAGTGLLVAFGTNHQIIHRGDIQATGNGLPDYGPAIGARFDFGVPYSGVSTPEEFKLLDNQKSYGKYIDFADTSLIMYDLDGPLVSKFDVTGSISGTDAAIYIGDSAHVETINLMSGAVINGDIVSDYDDRGNGTTRSTLLTFGKLADANGEATNSGDSTFDINITDNIGGKGKFDLETWGGETTLSAATLKFNKGTIGADSTNVKSTLNLPGTVTFSNLNLGSVNNTASVLDGKTTGKVTTTSGVANRITVQNLASFNVPALDNYGVIEDNEEIIVTGNVDNKTTGQILDTGTLTVGGKLTNDGTVDTAKLIEVTDDVDNNNMITNVTTLDSKANLNNGEFAQLDTNTNIKVGGKLTNDGTVDTAKLIEVTGDVDNNAKITNVTTLDAKANLNNTGNLVNNPNIKVDGKLTNNGTVNTATLVDVKGDIENTDEIQNVATVQTAANLSNTVTGQLLNNTNVKVGNKLTNAGLIDTANLVDVTGDIDNVNDDFYNPTVGLIQNVVTLQTAANLNNKGVGAQIVDNKTVNAGVNLTNDGLIDRFTTVNVGQDVTNNPTGYINVANDSTVNIGRNGLNSGYIKVNGNVNVENQFINNAGDYVYVDGAGTVTTKKGFINNGNIAPGNSIDTLTVVGSFVNNATGKLHIELDPSHYPSKPFAGLHNDLIDVQAGTATINGGDVLVTSPSNDKTKTATPARYVGNTHYTFLDTDKAGNLIVSKELTAHDPADILLFDFLADHDTKSYWLDVQREYYYGKFGDTFNQVAVGDYIDEIGLDPDPTGDFFGVLVTLDKLNGGIAHRAGISKAAKFSLDQMSGAIYGTIANAGIQNTTIVNNTLADVLRRDAFGNTNGCNPCEDVCATKISSRWNTWGLGYGTGGETQFDGNVYGYNQSFAGTLVGVDRSYKRSLRVGAFASYGEGKISSDLLEHSKSKEFLAGLYLRKGMKIGYILASGGLGNNRYDTERTISFVNRKTQNKHDAIVGTVYLERGLELKNRYGNLQPFFGIQYVGSQQNGFAEHGAQSLNLAANATDGHSLRSLLGSRFSTNSRTVNKGKLSLYGNAIWMHEFLRSYTNFTAEFSNPGLTNFSSTAKFTVRGNDSKRDWAIIGAGLNYDKNRIRLFGGYDAYANGQQVLHTGNAGIVYGW